MTPGNFGPDADVFLGQLNAISSTPNSDARDKTTFALPSGLAVGADGRLYVSDGRGRVLVFRNPSATGQAADRILGLAVQVQGQPALTPVNDTQ